jgi:hypothetical protein
VGPRAGLDGWKISPPPPTGIRSPDHPARRSVTILTELSSPLYFIVHCNFYVLLLCHLRRTLSKCLLKFLAWGSFIQIVTLMPHLYLTVFTQNLHSSLACFLKSQRYNGIRNFAFIHLRCVYQLDLLFYTIMWFTHW